MDRFASNTLRTLSIVAISIFVIIGSLVLLLLALCAGMFGAVGSASHHDPQTTMVFYGSILAAAVLVIIGVLSIAKLAKGIVRGNNHAPHTASRIPIAFSRALCRTSSHNVQPLSHTRRRRPSFSRQPFGHSHPRPRPCRANRRPGCYRRPRLAMGSPIPPRELPSQLADCPGIGRSFQLALPRASVQSA